jgi:hypothetical protein
MATQTTHFDMVKQQSAERVSVGLLNDNFDIIDGVMFANQEKSEQLADDYNASETYNTDDYVRRENYLYKCNTDNTTGTWDDTKWDRVKVMDEISQGGGGGSSTLAGLNDVSLASPTDGQLLGYNGTSHKWENVNGGGGGSSTFAGLNDVNVQGVSNGDIARYNSTTGKWTDSSDLSDLELTVAQLQASVLSITDGHTVIDSNGTAMAQEDDLQFASGCVEDDPVNGKTIYIEMIRISQANYNTLKANGQLKPGAKYFIYDAQPVAVNASNLPYSSTQSTKQKIDEIETVTTENLATGIDIVRCGKIRTVRLNFFAPTSTIFYTLSSTDCPKIDITAIVRWQATDNKYYSALITIQTNGNISASYFTGSTAAFINNGTITGALTFLTA